MDIERSLIEVPSGPRKRCLNKSLYHSPKQQEQQQIAFIEWLLCGMHLAECFIWIISFIPHNSISYCYIDSIDEDTEA